MIDKDDFVGYNDCEDDESLEDILRVFKNKVSRKDALDVLEQVDYDVDLAIAKLKQRLESRKKKATPSVNPAQVSTSQKGEFPTRLQRLSQIRSAAIVKGLKSMSLDTFQSESVGQHHQTRVKLPVDIQQNEEAKISKLASLARRRAQATTGTDHMREGVSNQSAADVYAPLPLGRAKTLAGSPESKARESPTRLKNHDIESPKRSIIQFPYLSIMSYCIPPVTHSSVSSFGALIKGTTVPVQNNKIANQVDVGDGARSAFSELSPDAKILSNQAQAFDKNGTKTKVKSTFKSVQTLPKKNAQAVERLKSEVLSEIASFQLKPQICFVVIGHVDAGKSTLTGRLLHDIGAVTDKELKENERQSSRQGKSSFALAWVMDATEEERHRGVTVDYGEAVFETKNARFRVLDAPGHRDYVPNMIAGVAQADVAILVADASGSAFESGFSMDGQTREHALLARSLGIGRMIVAVNKLDTANWSHDRFNEISMQLKNFLTKSVGYSSEQIVFVPISGREGAMVVKKTAEPVWYEGPTLLEALENTDGSISRVENASKPCIFIVASVHQDPKQARISLTGCMAQGIIVSGDMLVDCNSGDEAVEFEVLNIGAQKFGGPGEVLEIIVRQGIENLHPGDVLTTREHMLKPARRVTARVVLFDLPKPLLKGTKLSLYLGRVDTVVTVVKLVASLDKKGNVLKKSPRHISKGQAARLVLEFESNVIVTPASENKQLSKLILRLEGKTVGGAVVEQIEF